MKCHSSSGRSVCGREKELENIDIFRRHFENDAETTDLAVRMGELKAKKMMEKSSLRRSILVLLELLFFVSLVSSQGKLEFRPLMHQPRIYQGAPAGVHVTTVHAYDPDRPRNPVVYNLQNVLDHEYFVLDQNSGNLTTAKSINRNIGETYQVMVAAASFGLSELKHLQIAVTEFNQFAPRFEKLIYRAELHALTQIDTPVLQLKAHDPDPAPHNAEVYYRMDQNASSNFFTLDALDGRLILSQPLNTSETVLRFGVFAEDGGSPKRWAHVQVEVDIKALSMPEDISVSNITISSATLCWGLPMFGDVTGYLLEYRETGMDDRKTKNVTSDLLNSCVTLDGLKDGVTYAFQVYAWNPEDIGQTSDITTFTTIVNYCLQSVCKKGACSSLTSDPWYHCECPNGYYGQHCEFFDACSTRPCGKNGNCLNTTNKEYVCICDEEYTGPNCGSYNPCLRRLPLCHNGGECKMTTNHTYVCSCTPGYYGRNCQKRNLCYSSPCHNGGTCTNTSDTTFTCTCPPGITGDLCEEDIDECASDPCVLGSTCLNNKGNFSCRCVPGSTGITCDTPEQCPQDKTETDEGMIYWNATNHSIRVMVKCPLGSMDDKESGFASRICRLEMDGRVSWGPVNASSCRSKGYLVAEELTDELNALTMDPSKLNNERLEAVAQGIETIATFATKDKKLAQGMVNVISNVLNANASVIEQDEDGTVSDSLLQIVDEFTSKVQMERGENLTLETPNLRIHTMEWHPELAKDYENSVVFNAPSPPGEEEAKDQFGEGAEEPSEKDKGAFPDDHIIRPIKKKDQMMQVFVPHEALHEAHRHTDGDVRVKFVVFYNGKLFRPRKETPPEKLREGGNKSQDSKHRKKSGDIKEIKQPVLQITVGNISLTNLFNPLIYIFPLVTKQKVQCVFWKDQEREWSTEGLTTNHTERFVICQSTHLTAFSILLDPTPLVGVSEDHEEVLSLISYIGSALSILGLFLTILTYSLFRCLNRDHQGKILLNLCISLLLMNVTFLFGSLNSSNGRNVCALVAILIHYFLLASLSWMCVEAFNMYQLLVHVFASAETHFILKRCLIAWGGPLFIVAISAFLGYKDYYNQDTFCLLSPRNIWVYYFAYLMPSCLMLLVNVTVFILVSKVLFSPRLTSKTSTRCIPANPTVTAAQVRGAFTVMVLLGVTWVFGTFAVGEAKLIFQYIFCITNSLQGFLIFLVRCLHYPEARSAWIQLIKSGKFKKYRGVLPPGAISWSTNSHSGGKNNGQMTSRFRSDSTDATGSLAINSGCWNKCDCRQPSRRCKHQNAFRTYSHEGLKKSVSLQNGKRIHHPGTPSLAVVSNGKCPAVRPEPSRTVESHTKECNGNTGDKVVTEQRRNIPNCDDPLDVMQEGNNSESDFKTENGKLVQSRPLEEESLGKEYRSSSLDVALANEDGNKTGSGRKKLNLLQRRWCRLDGRRSASVDAAFLNTTNLLAKNKDEKFERTAFPRLAIGNQKLVSDDQIDALGSACTVIDHIFNPSDESSE